MDHSQMGHHAHMDHSAMDHSQHMMHSMEGGGHNHGRMAGADGTTSPLTVAHEHAEPETSHGHGV